MVGCQREFFADRAPNLHVNFWSVKRGFVFHFHIAHAAVLHRLAHHIFGLEPETLVVNIFLAETFFGVRAKTHHIFFNPENLKVFHIEINNRHELFFKLLFRAVDVGIVHLHRADAHQPKKFAAFFVAVAGSILRQADGQVAIAARAGSKNLMVHRAIHRLDVII